MHIFAYFACFVKPIAVVSAIIPKLILLAIVLGTVNTVIDKRSEQREVNLKRKLLNATKNLQRLRAAARPPPPPTPAALMRQLITAVAPLRTYVRQGGQGASCNICLEPFEEGAVVRQLKCTHIFHTDCIDEWLHKSFTCGYCRQALF